MLDDVLRRQEGVIARWQALTCGLTDGAIRSRIEAGRWRRIYDGVFAAFSGPPPRLALLWAAVLWAAVPSAVDVCGAALAFTSAAELDGLVDPAPSRYVHVMVPWYRRPGSVSPAGPVPGIMVHRSRRFSAALHPARLPPRARLEETTLDLACSATGLDEAMGWLSRACQSRLTTPSRLLAALSDRPKSRWRAEFTAALSDVGEGAHGLLELRYLRWVERAHGLPRGQRQFHVGGRYEDVRYVDYGVVVELDGRIAHPDDERFRDMRRDNASVRSGLIPLRYGWGDVVEHPCTVAKEVAITLQSRGWRGAIHDCGRYS